MTSYDSFNSNDLFQFNQVNLDSFTQTFKNAYYLKYLARWTEYNIISFDTNGTISGYLFGHGGGYGSDTAHGHITAVTVAPYARRIGIASQLIHHLEYISESIYHAYYVDLFVRASNKAAQRMYQHLGYVRYRRILKYYSGDEDAWDMRKPMKRYGHKPIIPLRGGSVRPEDILSS